MNRDCPVCKSSEKSHLYRQKFTLISEAFPIKHYDVVTCKECGFAFADDVPNQSELDTYYKDLSKYENNQHAGQPSQGAMRNYVRIVESINPFLPDKNVSIADIGCATGGLLSAFQQKGYANLFGVDPSDACARTAINLYGVRVIVSSLFDVKPPSDPFDVLVFSSVMEHIIDLNNALLRMREMLSDSGLMVIDVPDTVNFSNYLSAPFQQFSVEHVNFFTPISLSNLLMSHGFEPVAMWHDIRTLGEISDPSLTAIARKIDKKKNNLSYDFESTVALERYIDCSREGDKLIVSRIKALVQGQQPIIIWGAGTQTQRLLATSELSKANISVFVDSNANYYGKKLNGKPIISPSQLRDYNEPIVIISQVYQNEIAKTIKNSLNLKNDIIYLLSIKY